MVMPQRQAGSVALEMVFVGPALILLLLFVAVGGRILTAKGEVQGAARDAARAASLSRADASADARAAAAQTLDQAGLRCASFTVSLDPAGGAPPGNPVAAEVACEVRVSDLGLPGFPGSKTLRVTMVSPVDSYVGR